MSKLKTLGNPQIRDEASQWFVEFSDGELDVRARADFDAWLRRSPEHVRAYLQVAATWERTKGIADREQASEAQLIARALAEDNVVALRAPATADTTASPAAHESTRRRAPRFAMAASVALVCSLAAGFFAWQQRSPLYETGAGEQRVVTLTDGSTIELNSRSKLRVSMRDTEREIHLLEGQAIFRVAKDPNRPFVVHSGDTRVRAVGTEFDVYRKREGTVITVLEGKVAVMPAAESAGRTNLSGSGPNIQSKDPGALLDSSGAIMLAAGQQVVVTPQSIESPKLADIEVATSWTQRRVVFDSTRLDVAVDELNRYSPRQIVLNDSDLASYHISGSFSSADPRVFLRFLEQRFGIEVVESDSRIEIHRK